MTPFIFTVVFKKRDSVVYQTWFNSHRGLPEELVHISGLYITPSQLWLYSNLKPLYDL